MLFKSIRFLLVSIFLVSACNQEQDKNVISPTGSLSGRGGYLEYNTKNLIEFKQYFKSSFLNEKKLLELTTVSSVFSEKYPDYQVLPPRDQWPHMKKTLQLLNTLQSITQAKLNIVSAYRTSQANRISKGAKGSKHLDFYALDIVPSKDFNKIRAFLKHYWWQKGSIKKLGLGYYRNNRFHIDTYRHRRWNWKDSKQKAAKEYKRYFDKSLSELIK